MSALTAAPDQNILLAFDFGLRRIGVATANLLTETSVPIATLNCANEVPWTALDSLIEEWQPGRLIVGKPDEVRAGSVAESAATFAEALRHRYDLPVDTVDESLTSRAAESELREARESGIMKRRVKKADIDSRAACLIAEQWIRAHSTTDTSLTGE